ncbi:MAG: glycosyltransferase family 4 protein [Alphaproteobacteria bacterium]
MTLRVLCLDIEGGHGGSSRSLYESIRHMGDAADLEVWCRRGGAIETRYAALGVPVTVCPDMPKVTALPRFSRNLYMFADFALRWMRTGAFRARLARHLARMDVVHLNHESLFWLSRWLRRNTRAAVTMHIRTCPWDSPFARMQARTIRRNVDAAVFISENERRNLEHQADGPISGRVIYNIAPPAPSDIMPHPAVPQDTRLRIACLSNYTYTRGTDRVIDLAAALARRGRRDFTFVVAGEMGLSRSLPGELGRIGRRGGTLADYAAARQVEDMVLFLGHVADPERVLEACDILIKPTREANPWGRDILEALAAGRPAISVGTYDRFVETGATGILQTAFDADDLADRLIALDADRDAIRRMGDAAKARIATLCDGPSRARELFELWRDTAAATADRRPHAA